MKNIGIITFHCSYNYGSVLQAYALQTYLEKKGYKTRIIDFVLKSDFEQYHLFRWKKYKRKPQYILADLLYLSKTIKRKNNFIEFQKKHLKLTDKKYYDTDSLIELNNIFDAFICGSDQIWNLACTKCVVEQYFLGFAQDDKLKIAYAPSIANSRMSIGESDSKLISKLINRLDCISVREKSTIRLMQSYTSKKIVEVLDPTLLLDLKDYFDLIESNETNKENYIFYYTLQKNRDMEEYCKVLSKQKKLKILYISKVGISEFKNSENIYGCSPIEFLKYIVNSKYVITNSFHAMVFSVIFERKFCVFLTQGSSSRMKDLLNQLELIDRVWENNDFIIDKDIDYVDIKKQLELLKIKSEHFLNSALNNNGDYNE